MAPVLDKQQAHDLIDRLQPEQVPAAVSFLRSMLAFLVEDFGQTMDDFPLKDPVTFCTYVA
jgi:hypothetical protein